MYRLLCARLVVPPPEEDGASVSVRAVDVRRLHGQIRPLLVAAMRLLLEEAAASVVRKGEVLPRQVGAMLPRVVEAQLMALLPLARQSESLHHPQHKVQVMENTGQAPLSVPVPSIVNYMRYDFLGHDHFTT
jgi:hypothetical protein